MLYPSSFTTGFIIPSSSIIGVFIPSSSIVGVIIPSNSTTASSSTIGVVAPSDTATGVVVPFNSKKILKNKKIQTSWISKKITSYKDSAMIIIYIIRYLLLLLEI